jgi:DNA mismatch endonuclease (patch repair protein)
MTDSLTPEARSALMARIQGKNTKPEIVVRRLLHAMGYYQRSAALTPLPVGETGGCKGQGESMQSWCGRRERSD